ncbi:hypothetical protein HNP32_002672 [Brevundimonas bullata]|uniref:Uncharacterized protein n=1 Tax=Brevundimonas bullata TaxID=13160 RepID=A0A7W7N406_9CAUL|nr:hypothetical protein [Brevundimonas bullata]MBB4798918.1 hypothetical protein [Brevundimonas bullata]MBB6383878.1 hypothetical protein [Brevundimonas bullata]
MIFSPVLFAFYVSWAVTGLGVALWIWSWVRVKDPIGRLRFQDCGVVLVFAAVLTRIVIQNREMTVFDWAMIFLGPLFIAAALWRLSRTQGLTKS